MKIENIKPLPGYLLVEPDAAPNKTAGGIYLPDSNKKEASQSGTVLRTGNRPGQEDSPVNKGDHIVYQKWAGNTLTINNKDYELLKYEDVLAVDHE